jgi:hypothetical protein
MDLKHLKAKLKKAAAKKDADGGEANVSRSRRLLSVFALGRVLRGPPALFPFAHDRRIPTLQLHSKHPAPKPTLNRRSTDSQPNPNRQTLDADIARWAEEIPATEALAVQMATELGEAEAKLEGLLEGIKGEVEGHHQALAKVRAGG